MRGHFTKAGVPPKLIVKEFPVTEDAHIPVGESSLARVPSIWSEAYTGTTLSAAHFVPGQYVDVIGKSYVGLPVIRPVAYTFSESEKAMQGP